MPSSIRNVRLRLPQGQIFWRELGRGATVVFLHGEFQDSHQWLPFMAPLAREYHCLVPDLMGFGESFAPRKQHQSIHWQAETLRGWLERLHCRQVYLVGMGLGAWVAATYGQLYPEQVQGVALISPLGLEEGEKLWWREKWDWRWGFLYRPLWRSLQKLGRKLRRSPMEGEEAPPEIRPRCRASGALLFNRRQAEIRSEFVNRRLSQVTCPAVVIREPQRSPGRQLISDRYQQLLPQVGPGPLLENFENPTPEAIVCLRQALQRITQGHNGKNPT